MKRDFPKVDGLVGFDEDRDRETEWENMSYITIPSYQGAATFVFNSDKESLKTMALL